DVPRYAYQADYLALRVAVGDLGGKEGARTFGCLRGFLEGFRSPRGQDSAIPFAGVTGCLPGQEVPAPSSNHLLRRFAQDTGSRGIDFPVSALHVFDEDRVGGALHHGPQHFVALVDGLFGLLAFGDVPPQGHRQAFTAMQERPDPNLDRKLASVLAAVPRFECEGLAGGHPAPDSGYLLGGKSHVEIARKTPQHFLPGISQAFARLAVYVQDPAAVLRVLDE